MKRLGVNLMVALVVSAVAITAQSPAASSVADAAKRGDRAALKTLLTQGADVSAPQGDGMTALHWAAERGDSTMADMLVFAGANISALTRIGQYTPLHLASRSGSAAVVRTLLKAGAKMDARTSTSSVTPLHLAAASGNVDTVAALLDAGADANVTEGEANQTPLIFAAAEGRTDVVMLLLKRGAKVNATSKLVDLSKQSATDRQATQLERSIIRASVATGQDPTPSAQIAAVEAARELYRTGKMPEPPAAAAAGGAGGAAGGGNAGAAGGGGGGRQGGRAGQGGAAADTGTGIAPAGNGNTGGTGGAGGGNGAANALNEDGPPPAISSKGAMTALHYAVRQGYLKTATALLDGGAEVNKKTGDGNTPLLVAAINGQFDMAMLLIERGANVNTPSDGYFVPPLWAVVNAQWQPRTRYPQPQEMDLQKATYLDVMKALLDRGADPNARIRVHPWYLVYTGCGNGNCGLTSTVGSTAFWRAAYGTDVDAMKLLVKYGADPNIATMSAARAAGGGAGRAGGGGGGRAGGGAAAGRAGGAGAGLDNPDSGLDNPQPPATQGGRGGGAGGPDPSGVPPAPGGGPSVFPIHAAAGVEYGEGYAGNSHRHAPDGWLASVKYLVEELGADVNQRDSDGYTPLHHAAARGDNELILYLVSKGADVKALSRRNQTTADMANGPVSRISPIPETIALLEKLGSKNNHKCASCTP